MLKAYKSLPPKTRLGVGLAIIAWAATGLYLSDKAEETFGYTPTDKDKEDLRKLTPRIVAVERKTATTTTTTATSGGGDDGR